jgi:hypothetical protein
MMKFSNVLHSTLLTVGYVVALFLLGSGSEAQAATHTVNPNTNAWDCQSRGVRPGDKIVMTGTSRSKVKFENCYGSASNPITITNDISASEALVINQAGDGFSSQCINCEYVVIDGTGKWRGAPSGVCGASIANGEWRLGTSNCGIVFRCVSGTPQSGLRLAGSSKHVTVKGVEIDGNVPTCTRGIGLHINDHNYKAASADEWREGFTIVSNYIHDTGRSGVYFGPNQHSEGVGDLPVRSNEIANNYVDRVGCDGIKYKSVLAGSSSIHHNFVTNTGRSSGEHEDGCGANGISLFESGYTDVFSNYVESPAPVADGPGNCIAQSTTQLSSARVQTLPVRIYNNVVHNCKGKGISSARKGRDNPEPIPTIFNNTIVAPVGGGGISVDSMVSTCSVRNNIVSGVTIRAGHCTTSGNTLEPVDAQRFISAGDDDFRLTANSPAVDSASGQCPPDDLAGNDRPQGGACDSGAYEYVTGTQTASKPRPPAPVSVE